MANKKPKLLSTGDWVHIGIASVAVIVSALGVALGQNLVAKLISGAVGVAFIASVLIMILAFRLPAYREPWGLLPPDDSPPPPLPPKQDDSTIQDDDVKQEPDDPHKHDHDDEPTTPEPKEDPPAEPGPSEDPSTTGDPDPDPTPGDPSPVEPKPADDDEEDEPRKQYDGLKLADFGIRFKLSPSLAGLTDAEVVKWTIDMIDFWHEKKGWSYKDIEDALRGHEVTAHDQMYLWTHDAKGKQRKAKAYTYADHKITHMAVYPEGVAKANAKSLYRHELSHTIVARCGGYWGEVESHRLFKSVGLGA